MKRVLLTGAGPRGFVGRNIAPFLAERYTLFTPDSSELDLRDLDSLKKYISIKRIDTIVHSAVHNTITRGAENALQFDLQMYFNIECVSGMVDKVLYFGSGAEFDKRLPIDMVVEEDFGRSIPTDYYGFCKYIANKNTVQSKNIYNLRIFGVFGKYEYWPLKFISNLCCKAVFGMPLSVRKNCMFDFLFVEDLGPIVSWYIDHTPKYKDYNICTGMPIDLITIANIVSEVSEKSLLINVLAEGWNLPYTADNTRMRNEISDLHITGMKKAVGKLYKYYNDNKETVDYNILAESK